MPAGEDLVAEEETSADDAGGQGGGDGTGGNGSPPKLPEPTPRRYDKNIKKIRNRAIDLKWISYGMLASIALLVGFAIWVYTEAGERTKKEFQSKLESEITKIDTVIFDLQKKILKFETDQPILEKKFNKENADIVAKKAEFEKAQKTLETSSNLTALDSNAIEAEARAKEAEKTRMDNAERVKKNAEFLGKIKAEVTSADSAFKSAKKLANTAEEKAKTLRIDADPGIKALAETASRLAQGKLALAVKTLKGLKGELKELAQKDTELRNVAKTTEETAAKAKQEWEKAVAKRDKAMQTIENLKRTNRRELNKLQDKADKTLRDYDSTTNSLKESRDRLKAVEAKLEKVKAEELKGQQTDLIFTVQTNITRFGTLIIIIYVIQLLIGLYRYNIRLEAFYWARVDALRLVGVDSFEFTKLAQILSPDKLDFGKAPKSPTDQLMNVVKELSKTIGKLKPSN